MSFSYLEYQRHLPDWDADIDTGLYYANAALAGFQSLGLHVNIEVPMFEKTVDHWRSLGGLIGIKEILPANAWLQLSLKYPEESVIPVAGITE